MSVDLDILIVAYHAKAALSETLQSVALWTSPGYRLTVYDNSVKNLPLTWLWNNFIKQSRRPFVALLNPDIVLSAGWSLETLACMEEHPKCGVAAPITNNVFHSAKFGAAADQAFLPAEGKEISDKLAEKSLPRFSFFTDFQAAPGHCLVIRREAWEMVSGFDFRIPFAGNDYDFNDRIVKASMLLGICAKAACYHKWGQSIKEGTALGTFDVRGNIPKFSSPPEDALFSSI